MPSEPPQEAAPSEAVLAAGRGVWVSRMRIQFRAEPPLPFAKRMQAAHAEASRAQKLIALCLAAESMPADGLPTMPTRWQRRILELSDGEKGRGGSGGGSGGGGGGGGGASGHGRHTRTPSPETVAAAAAATETATATATATPAPSPTPPALSTPRRPMTHDTRVTSFGGAHFADTAPAAFATAAAAFAAFTPSPAATIAVPATAVPATAAAAASSATAAVAAATAATAASATAAAGNAPPASPIPPPPSLSPKNAGSFRRPKSRQGSFRRISRRTTKERLAAGAEQAMMGSSSSPGGAGGGAGAAAAIPTRARVRAEVLSEAQLDFVAVMARLEIARVIGGAQAARRQPPPGSFVKAGGAGGGGAGGGAAAAAAMVFGAPEVAAGWGAMHAKPALSLSRSNQLDRAICGDLAQLAQSELVAPRNTKPGPPVAVCAAGEARLGEFATQRNLIKHSGAIHLLAGRERRRGGDGVPNGAWRCAFAAQGGDLAALQYLRQHGAAWDSYTCAKAAEGGHTTLLSWVLGQGGVWDERTCAAAAAGGHLETLQWLRAQEPPCPWDERATDWAVHNGQWETARWARSQGCGCSDETRSALASHSFRRRGSIGVVTAVHGMRLAR